MGLREKFVKESWNLAIRKREGNGLIEDNGFPFKVIKNGLDYWLADPFLFEKNGICYIFAEKFNYKTRKGTIAYTLLDEKKNVCWGLEGYYS